MEEVTLINGDCIEEMKKLEDNSIDCVICDLPYGTTACKWDVTIPFEEMWKEINRVVKDDAAICLFGVEPFSSMLRLSNLKGYKYDWVWHKSKCGSAFTSKYRLQQKHELISVFSKRGGKVKYNPQMLEGEPYYRYKRVKDEADTNNHKLGITKENETINTGYRYPETVIYFQQKWRRQDQIHPTQKPVELMKYLIKTYTDAGDTVLDFTMGSGTTGIACKNLNRKFIGIELDENYFNIAEQRILNKEG